MVKVQEGSLMKIKLQQLENLREFLSLMFTLGEDKGSPTLTSFYEKDKLEELSRTKV